MTQRRALRQPGGARSELDIDRIVELQLRTKRADFIEFSCRRRDQQRIEVVHTRRRLHTESDHVLQRRQFCRSERARCGVRKFRGEIVEHFEVVAGLETRREHERLAADLVECVLELAAAVGGIDVDQDQPGLRASELRQYPFGAVRRPDADALARGEAESTQARREAIDALAQFAPGPADILVPCDQRIALAVLFNGPVEVRADRIAEQRDI